MKKDIMLSIMVSSVVVAGMVSPANAADTSNAISTANKIEIK